MGLLPEREAPADHDPLARRGGKEDAMSAEENKAVVRRMLDELREWESGGHGERVDFDWSA